VGDDLRSRAFAIRTLDPDDDDWTDLEPLVPILSRAKVIAVGESAHYTREFHLLKDRLLRFLVAKLGVTAFAMESGFPEGLSVSRWLAGADEDLDALLQRGFTNGFGNSAEMRDQLLWMRDRGIRFYGVDVPGTGWSHDAAIAEIARRDPEAAQRLRTELTGITPATGPPIEPERHAALLALLDAIGSSIGSSDDGDADAARVVSGLIAYVDMALSTSAFDRRRDEAMADAVMWMADREPCVLLGGANGHVQRVEYPTRFGPLRVLGQRLSARLGPCYVAVGTTFARGSTISRHPSVKPVKLDMPASPADSKPTVDDLLAAAGLPLFAIETQSLDDGPETSAMRENLDVLHIDVRSAFDVLVHIDEFRPATPPHVLY
jgi:erythromycin esterase